jgi:S-adenosyl-L-methionine hydrolase (adenosine-forming)
MAHLISILTDFGTEDPFVGEMKAVIFSICPDATLVDITHHVERFNIQMGAFLLASSTPYFPAGTVHLAVVDPGVGGGRRPIAIETSRSFYVGPDNGLLIPAAKSEGIQRVYHLTNASLMLDKVSSTFHGRDIFAPVAAHLACGTPPKEVGDEVTDFVQLSYGEAQFTEHGATCKVIHIDHFGNVITSLSEEQLEKLKPSGTFTVTLRRKRFSAKLVKSFSAIEEKQFGLIIGSHGFLEIATRENSASKRLKTKTGDTISIRSR